MSTGNEDVSASGAVLAPSAAARRWARREAGRLLLERADAGLVSRQVGHHDPAYGLDFAPSLARFVADDLTPDRTLALVEELLLVCHTLAAAMAVERGGRAREHAPMVVRHLLAGLDRIDPIEVAA